MDVEWIGRGKVRARESGGVLEVVVDGLTTQAKYYKPLIYEFFRKEWRGSRPTWGEFSVEIGMEYIGDPPWLDGGEVVALRREVAPPVALHDGLGRPEQGAIAGHRAPERLPERDVEEDPQVPGIAELWA